MTTVAYRDGVMAADTMGSWSGDINFGVPKLAKTERFLLGFSGGYPFVHPMYEWIVGKKDLPLHQFYKEPPDFDTNKSSGVTVLVAPIDGSPLWYFAEDGHGCQLFGRQFESVGSGARFALGAMQIGASPVQAVHAAIALDDGTGGDVVQITRESAPCTIFELDMTPVS